VAVRGATTALIQIGRGSYNAFVRGELRGRISITRGRAFVYNEQGILAARAFHRGSRVYVTTGNQTVGYAVIEGGGRVLYYREPGGEYLGYDLVEGGTIRHYDPYGQYTGRTVLDRPVDGVLAASVWWMGTLGSDEERVRFREKVRQAQVKLHEAGFDPGPIDGILGERTMTALREYQGEHELQETGLLDEPTFQSLNARTLSTWWERTAPTRVAAWPRVHVSEQKAESRVHLIQQREGQRTISASVDAQKMWTNTGIAVKEGEVVKAKVSNQSIEEMCVGSDDGGSFTTKPTRPKSEQKEQKTKRNKLSEEEKDRILRQLAEGGY
jgi:hypothetical protein